MLAFAGIVYTLYQLQDPLPLPVPPTGSKSGRRGYVRPFDFASNASVINVKSRLRWDREHIEVHVH